MRLLGMMLKVWAALALLVAIAIGVMVWQGGHDMTVSVADDVLDGPTAALVIGCVAAALIFAAGLILCVVMLLLGIVVPCAALLACAGILIALATAGMAVFGSLVLATSPLLIVVAACVLLVRALRRRRHNPAPVPV